MSIDTDYAVLRHVLTEYETHGWAVEFGVYSGTSLSIIAEHMPVIGFDSFIGLPEDWRPNFPKGRFSEEELAEPPYANQPFRTMLIDGWFKDTVPGFFFPKLGLVHIDCDLYSSTVTALAGVAPFIDIDTYVVFDEFQGYEGHEEHEMKAWSEFCDNYGVVANRIADGPEEAAFRIEDIDHHQMNFRLSR